MKTKLDNSNISIHLGQSSAYKSEYDSSLLVKEPRSNNRLHLNLSDDDLPFVGHDVWNAYEVSGLTDNGVPVTGFAKITYSCTNSHIVESKSLKLYFNTFNMTKLGRTPVDVLSSIEFMSARDLTCLLDTPVTVNVYSSDTTCSATSYFDKYVTLERNVNMNDVVCDVYNEDETILKLSKGKAMTKSLYHSSLLKSNCRVTSQPDWGDVYIYMHSDQVVDEVSLLQYIVSFRDECHFHEEICETIYKRFMIR